MNPFNFESGLDQDKKSNSIATPRDFKSKNQKDKK